VLRAEAPSERTDYYLFKGYGEEHWELSSIVVISADVILKRGISRVLVQVDGSSAYGKNVVMKQQFLYG
jgi:hypothetical protein